MNRTPSTSRRQPQLRIVIRFGRARLLRAHDGSYHLAGAGTRETTAAREWASLCCHEACFSIQSHGPAGSLPQETA
mgnify:CR=1 FL=1